MKKCLLSSVAAPIAGRGLWCSYASAMQHPSCRATKISQALALLDFEAKPWLQSHAWHTSASLQDMRALLLDLKQATGAQSLGHGSICDRLKIGYMGSVATSHGKAQQLASHQLCTRRNTELEPSGPTICAAQPGTYICDSGSVL